jgi:hypothetical protein
MPEQNNNGLQQNTDWLDKLITDKRAKARAKKVAEAAHGVLIECLSPERAVEAAVKHMIDQGYEVTKNRYLESGGYSLTFERYVGKTDGFQPGRFFLGRVILIVTPAGNGVGCRVRTSGSSGAGRNELEHVHRWAGQHLSRSYTASKLPVLLTEQRPLSTEEQTLLMGLYTEICNSWRKLTDVRFKLLGLVPVVSGFFLIRALSGGDLSPDIRVGIAVFGFIVTLALWAYEVRNSQLYDDLVSRGRRIEAELGVNTGHFRGRLKPSSRYLLGPLKVQVRIQHDSAINLIYGTSVGAWLLALIVILFGL